MELITVGLNIRTLDLGEDNMTPFFVFLMIHQQNSGRNCLHNWLGQKSMVRIWSIFVNCSQLPELVTVAGGKNR